MKWLRKESRNDRGLKNLQKQVELVDIVIAVEVEAIADLLPEGIVEVEVGAEVGILNDVTLALAPVLCRAPPPRIHVHVHHPALTLARVLTHVLCLALAHLGQEGDQDTEG